MTSGTGTGNETSDGSRERRRADDGPGGDVPLRRRFVLFGLIVVVIQIGLMAAAFVPAPHTGGDNAGYVSLAHALVTGQGYTELWDPAAPAHTKYPPVFPALLALWIAVGARSWLALKLVPAVFTTLAVLFGYLWAAQRRDAVFGAGVALLVASAAAVLYYSHWVLSEPTFLAFTFLGLWALERGGGEGVDAPEDDTPTTEEAGRTPSPLWVAVGLGAAVLAYFTRSAGLPLLVAVAGWLLWRRRWRLLGIFAVGGGAPALLWWLRGRNAAAGAAGGYVGEFWMVNPYQPELGRVGLVDLSERLGVNLRGYVTSWGPEGLVGAAGTAVAALGVALTVLALVAWGRRLVRGPHVAELFFPLYAGLILLWPEVWSGDRFALPLYPLVLFYAGEALLWVVGLWSEKVAPVVVGAAAVLVVVPALGAWTGSLERAQQCAAAVRSGGAYACAGPRWMEFGRAARWSGLAMPADAAVLSRKPRIFFVLSGLPGRTFPFSTDPAVFEAEVEDAGADVVILDHLDAQARRYLGGVIQARPELFCSILALGGSRNAATRTQILGLVDPATGEGGRIEEAEGGGTRVAVPPCPSDRLVESVDPRTLPPLTGEVPLLTGTASPR